jgi:hypothetical protein
VAESQKAALRPRWLHAQLLLALFSPGYFLNSVATEVTGNQEPKPQQIKQDVDCFPGCFGLGDGVRFANLGAY